MVVLDAGRRQLKAIQRALPREGVTLVSFSWTLLAGRVDLADQRRQQRVCAKVIVIVEVFIPERDAEDTLGQELELGVLNQTLIAIVDETISESLQQLRTSRDLTKQQSAPVCRDPTTGKIADHFSKSMSLKL
jgi:hypothetical protein